jgi:hypothetical protein
MTEDNKESSLEENLDMAQYIMLHRIYDILTLLANNIVGSDKTSKMVQYHEQGFLLGPNPSYSADVENIEENSYQETIDLEL